MSGMDDVVELPEDFSGQVRLFPLPDLVVFPHAMQPLHIFEPRYCDMLEDALASDRLIAMATLAGGIQSMHAQQPTIHATVCIGKIVSHVETEDGRHNILIIGAKRATVRRELLTNRSFRIADVDVASDFHPPGDMTQYFVLKREVLEAFEAIIPASATVQQNLHELMAGQMGLGPITDIISFTLPLGTDAKLLLLAEADVCQRARLLIRMLRERFIDKQGSASGNSGTQDTVGGSEKTKLAQWAADLGDGGDHGFPPRFSVN
ncbi:MAG TPA: ATP-dependent protease [Planctomycetaceae bacterium]|nr:ATP-dependent protease [Planctomycetaceae bacterium]